MVKKAKPKPKKVSAEVSPRVRKLNRKQKRQKAKKNIQAQSKIPSCFRLLAQVFAIFKRFWRPLGGIVLVYLILNIIFASGLSNLSSTVSNIKTNISGSNTHLLDALGGFGSLVGSAGVGSSSTGSALQSVLIVLESLVIIWALRQLLADKTIRVKQAYYQAMSPLVPFLLVIFVILLQLLPITLGSAALAVILTSVFSGGGFVTLLFVLLFALFAAWSTYMVSSSVFALYIVTLPDMEPRQALRSAKNLVQYRRWLIIRRLLFLPVFVLVAMAVLIVPLILFATWFVAPVFYVLSMLAILFVHSYLYSLYRSLLE